MRPVQPDDLGQHVRITRVALRPRHRVPLPVPRSRLRVDREHLITRRDQRGHPRAALGLDPDLHPPAASARRGRPTRPASPPRSTHAAGSCPSSPSGNRAHQPLAVLVDDLDVVMVLGPVITHEQHPHPPLTADTDCARQRGEDIPRSHSQSAHPKRPRGTTSQQRSAFLTTSGRTVCRKTSRSDPVSADPPAATSTEPPASARHPAITHEIRASVAARTAADIPGSVAVKRRAGDVVAQAVSSS